MVSCDGWVDYLVLFVIEGENGAGEGKGFSFVPRVERVARGACWRDGPNRVILFDRLES